MVEVFENKEYRSLYIETYGCAMNVSDSEIVAAVLAEKGFKPVRDELEADVVFLNTCAVRDNAEQKIWNRLNQLKAIKKKKPGLIVGVLGCMAERLKTQLLEEEKLVDMVVGPDAYRTLPDLIQQAIDGSKAVNVQLSREETYADLNPVRLNSNGVSAFISIMRGCNNMCSFCVVPFTRGRERSRDPESIVKEAQELFDNGFREVTLLGQNVDSYVWQNETGETICSFAGLLERVALVNPQLRIRFSTSHPKDINDDVLFTMIKYPNICKHIHLPVQSGSSRVLDIMNRNYTREWYMEKVIRIRELMPECSISTDIITGFCTETEDEHRDTLSLMEWAGFDFAYMYAYSERPGTLAQRKYTDDVSSDVKGRRLREIIEMQNRISNQNNKNYIGKKCRVLVENTSKRNDNDLMGRNDQNIVVVFPALCNKPGEYVEVMIEQTTTTTLIGKRISL